MLTNNNHLQSQYPIVQYDFAGGSRTEKYPAIIQNQPPFPWELELGVFLCIFTLLLLSCGTMPPDYFLLKLGPAALFWMSSVFKNNILKTGMKYEANHQNYYHISHR
jgi:hypothetical protein